MRKTGLFCFLLLSSCLSNSLCLVFEELHKDSYYLPTVTYFVIHVEFLLTFFFFAVSSNYSMTIRNLIFFRWCSAFSFFFFSPLVSVAGRAFILFLIKYQEGLSLGDSCLYSCFGGIASSEIQGCLVMSNVNANFVPSAVITMESEQSFDRFFGYLGNRSIMVRAN